MTTMTPVKAFRAVASSAESLRHNELQTVGTVSPGDVIRQGDLYLVALRAEMLPTGPVITERQLAPGATQGSRHVLTGDCTIVTPGKAASDLAKAIDSLVAGAATQAELLGPVFTCVAGVVLTHPEHGDIALPDGETFAVVYQRALAEEVRRQQD